MDLTYNARAEGIALRANSAFQLHYLRTRVFVRSSPANFKFRDLNLKFARAEGIEPSSLVLETKVLPLNDARKLGQLY